MFASIARRVFTRYASLHLHPDTDIVPNWVWSGLAIQLCPDIVFAATPPYDGTLGRYYKTAADLTYLLPEHLTLEDGAMVRVSSCPSTSV